MPRGKIFLKNGAMHVMQNIVKNNFYNEGGEEISERLYFP